MRKARPINKEAKDSLERRLKEAKTKGEFQRIQCMWLRAELSLSATEVAKALGWQAASVRNLWSHYFTEGESFLLGKSQGGRRRENLSLQEERNLLADFQKKATTGGIIIVIDIKSEYEKAVGHEVPYSTVYRMLARHGWRKIVPRPRHPKSNPEIENAFKKTSQS